MKGFLATALVLLEEADLDALRAPVHLCLSYDEEIGCVGARGPARRIGQRINGCRDV
ncbi:MAG: hypothetical protein CM1200mP26_19160 [Acidimicrobiales bacterium]|nr:MAG: hypothetical protein CM1200mP26_19160 [Acidimicrobiales bacterium]